MSFEEELSNLSIMQNVPSPTPNSTDNSLDPELHFQESPYTLNELTWEQVDGYMDSAVEMIANLLNLKPHTIKPTLAS
jgi:hypothetical protein